MRRNHLLSGERDAESVESCLQPEVFGVGNDRSRDGDLEPLAVLLKLPLVRRLVARPAPADACVRCEIAWMSGRAVTGEIVGRGDSDLAQVGTEFDRDHILLNDLADADRRVVTASHDIDDFVVESDIEHDVWVRIVKGA